MTMMVQVLLALLLGGLMGTIGQGIRAVAGLKKMNDDAQSQGATAQDLFVASRLVVSLIIGFIAGVIAASTLLSKLIALEPSDISVLFGIVAAGYAGTDFIEALAPTILGATGKASSPGNVATGGAGAVSPAAHAAEAPAGTLGYGSLVPGGFYSANPYDLGVSRSIRTNNPGALNYAKWQNARKGYVGLTQPDNSGNRTTIYRTPEHGTAAWYHLISQIYGFGAVGAFTLTSLAQRYAGVQTGPAVDAYIAGWTKWSNGSLNSTSSTNANDPSQMLVLAKAMFSHEAGQNTPVQDRQITFAIQNEQAGTLPS